jgi:hypothetical protein
MVPFLEDGLDAGEPMMVAVLPEHAAWLTDGLGDRAGLVEFIDMSVLGGNPARIIPALQEFLDSHFDGVRPVRGIGEPIWPGRRGGAAGVPAARGAAQPGGRPGHPLLANLPL